MEQAILWILAAGALVGGLDLLIGNRFGLGERFEEGFKLLGPTALSMAGILCLAPLLSNAFRVTIAPLLQNLHLDPAMLGGILAIDMGGYQMAVDLAQSPDVGRYAGILVASTLGCTISFTIPMSIGMNDASATCVAKASSKCVTIMPVNVAESMRNISHGMRFFQISTTLVRE